VRAHGIVAGAFGHGVEGVGEEAVGLVRELVVVARPLHQHGNKVDALEARALDVLADGAVADQSQPEVGFHDSRCSTQRAQATN
jgi:hypothetical protein